MTRRSEPRLRAATADSPCVQVCTMHPDGSHCVGCFRTLEEIGTWSTMDTPQREAIMPLLEQRRAQRRAQKRALRPSRRRAGSSPDSTDGTQP